MTDDRSTMAERWRALCSRIDCPALDAAFARLDAAYTAPHRAYHTWTHIEECLDVWRRSDEGGEHPDEVESAIWIHDAIYRPLRSDNEERSADLAVALLNPCTSSTIRPERVRSLILATRHPAPPSTPDEALLQDIDLHVLGADRERYVAYEADIRQEYRMVPAPLFRRKRADLLRGFLRTEHIFRTAWFRERFEVQARTNLTMALEALTRGAL